MESFYYPALKDDFLGFTLSEDEAKHLKALRIKENENFLVTNGAGLKAICLIKAFSKSGNFIYPQEYFREELSNKRSISLALSLLDNKDRFEFALEKAAELGVTDFYPLISRFVQNKSINENRLKVKAISAMKQSLNSRLMKIHPLQTVSELAEKANDFHRFILCDDKGKKPAINEVDKSFLILVGPEGGFSDEERELFSNLANSESWSLGENRLRAETAAVIAAALVRIL